MRKLAQPFIFLVERFYPDPFVFAILLSVVAFFMSWGLTDAGPVETMTAWGDGLPGLMTFIGQLSLTLIAAHALAHTDIVRRGLTRLGRLPKSAFMAYAMVAFVAAIASLFAWAFGLVVGALIARQVAMQAKKTGLRLHYPLLVAAAYGGFVVWHMGYSSSAALFVATPGHALEEQLDGILPVSQTIFAPWNMAIALVAVIVVPLLMASMKPKEDEIIEIPERAIEDYERTMAKMDRELGDAPSRRSEGATDRGVTATKAPPRGGAEPEDPPRTDSPAPRPEDQAATSGVQTLAQMLDGQRVISLIMGLSLAAYLAYYFSQQGLDLTLDIVNWSFLALGLILSRSPLHYVKLIANASLTVGQIILQYPFYAGIMGMMIGTGLVSVIAGWFIVISNATTLAFFAFLSGGILNYFIPSGGGQWAVQGPIFIEAAEALGTDPSRIVMGIAYGDQWSNMIQPFWTIPLLAIAGLHMRQIMGYTFIVFFVTFFIFGGGLLLAGAG